MDNNELKHYGVLGMKWGIRKDRGTSASRRRAKEKAKTKGWSKDAKEVHRIKSKKIPTLTNKELKAANERINLESKYRSLNRSNIAKGVALVVTANLAYTNFVTFYDNSSKLISIGKRFIDKG